MKLPESELLGRLGDGQSIELVCQAAGITRPEFDAWWAETTRRRAASQKHRVLNAVSADVAIRRDDYGIPHLFAGNDEDLFYGFGWAMAEDRLFQLDWLRRKAHGHLSEVLGPEGLPLDVVSRTVGLGRIAAAEWERLPEEVRQLVEAFSAGVNAHIEYCRNEGQLPVEFDLLRYQPRTWSPVDCLAIESEFRWYLTGRLPVICLPELARRVLGDGPLYREFLLGECDEESILHPGDYAADTSGALEPVGQAIGGPDDGRGSNNWVLSGSRTASGLPLLASDPHIAFEAVSCWYEAHLCGGSFNVAGMAYAGMPAIMFGRNERVAWGITNNICSQRDLYLERVDESHPGCFLYDGSWEPAGELTEMIAVRGMEPVEKTIRFSRNGPLVNELLPPAADPGDPVSLKWLGMHEGGWLTSLLAMDRAGSVAEFRAALQPWHVPTFSLVIADVDGRIGFQAAGRIPRRQRAERGFRRGWDPADQWLGLIPFDEMPAVDDPDRGWIASANNRLAPDDYPHPLSGTWSSGWRGVRIRQMIESRDRHSIDDMRPMHQDTVSLRAAELTPDLLAAVAPAAGSRAVEAAGLLKAWDFSIQPDCAATTIFNVFFTQWCRAVAQRRFPDADQAACVAEGIAGCAARLLRADPAGWFDDDRQDCIRRTFDETLHYLEDRLGPDMSQWTWGRLHRLPLRHVLSPRGDLSQLLDHGGEGVRGDMMTVCNTGSGPDWTAATGAGYRMIADLGSQPPALLAVDGQSQSGRPGSPHYSDQFDDWRSGRYHEIRLAPEGA